MKGKFLTVLIFSTALIMGACGGGDTNANLNRTAATPVSTPTATPMVANTDPALKNRIESALKAKGFNNVTVDITTSPATLRGTVPKGRMAEMIQTVNLANDMKPVTNQVTEEK